MGGAIQDGSASTSLGGYGTYYSGNALPPNYVYGGIGVGGVPGPPRYYAVGGYGGNGYVVITPYAIATAPPSFYPSFAPTFKPSYAPTYSPSFAPSFKPSFTPRY